jgi:hypothetical protein
MLNDLDARERQARPRTGRMLAVSWELLGVKWSQFKSCQPDHKKGYLT